MNYLVINNNSIEGKYTITARNPNGESSVDVNVIVLDAPDAPEGPLEVSDILADQCTLSWKPPVDEHGAPVTEYNVEMLNPTTSE